MYHIFIYSSVHEHLGCIHILAIVNNAAINLRVHVSFLITFFPLIYIYIYTQELGRFPWRRERLPTPVFWPGEFHGLYSPWGCKESDTTEQLSLTHITRSGIAGLYDNSIFILVRNPHNIFHNGCIILHFLQQCASVPFSPHPYQQLLLCSFG